MNWLNFSKNDNQKVRFRAMMESGILVDEIADVVQTQVIAHKARASIRNRDPIPLYHLTEEDHQPIHRENLLVETGLSQPPWEDSRYVLEESRNLFTGIRTRSVRLDSMWSLTSKHMVIVAYIASFAFALVCAWLAGLSMSGDDLIVPIEEEEIEIIEELQHGFIEETESTPGGTQGSEDTEATPSVDSGGTVLPLESQEVPDSGGTATQSGSPAP